MLSEGRVAYYGKLQVAEEFFKSIDYPCPTKYNPADYYIEILASKRKGQDNSQSLHAICDSYEKSMYSAITAKSIKDADEKYNMLDKMLYDNKPTYKKFV